MSLARWSGVALSVGAFLSCLVLAGGVAAQGEPGASAAGAKPAEAVGAPAAAPVGAPAAAEATVPVTVPDPAVPEAGPVAVPVPAPYTGVPRYARIESEEVALRCFPTDHSPVFDERLHRGDVVKVGGLRDGFYPVMLPLGVIGYVHSNFASGVDDGTVKTTGTKLAFRYRPNSREAPVAFVDQGRTFLMVGREGDWWKVRFPDGEAWVAAGDVLVFGADQESETLKAAYLDLDRRHRAATEAAVAEIEAARAVEAAERARGEKLAELDSQYQAEYAKARAEQDYGSLRVEVTALVSVLPGDSQSRVAAERLRQQIELQVKLIEAEALLLTEKVPARVEVPKPVVRDPLRELTVGWLRYDGGVFGERTFSLEKGGQVLYTVTCSSGRYDLSMFDGMEIGLKGTTERPHTESMRVFDIDRLEVFGKGRSD